jgi:hypothetical protein
VTSPAPDLQPKAQKVRTEIDLLIDRKIKEQLPRAGARVLAIPMIVGVPGSPLTTGTWGFYPLDVNRDARVVAWSVGASPSGSVTIDVQTAAKGALASAASICAGTLPFVASSTENSDQDPTGWTTDIPDGYWLVFVVTAVDGTVEVASVTLRATVLEDQHV